MLKPIYTYRLRFRQILYLCVSGEGPFDGQIGSGTHSDRQCRFDGDGDGVRVNGPQGMEQLASGQGPFTPNESEGEGDV